MLCLPCSSDFCVDYLVLDLLWLRFACVSAGWGVPGSLLFATGFWCFDLLLEVC